MKIKVWTSKRDKDNLSSRLGRSLIEKTKTAFIKYKRKKWSIMELLEFLIEENDQLKKNQCHPSAKCLFDVETHLVDYAIKEAEKELKYG